MLTLGISYKYNTADMLTRDLDKQISRISYNNIGLTDRAREEVVDSL